MQDNKNKWALIGLWGLRVINDNTVFEDPLFGDATLVSFESVYKMAENQKDKLALLGLESLEQMALRKDKSLSMNMYVQTLPHSFIAIRRQFKELKNVDENVRRRAREIASYLSCMHEVSTMSSKTFTTDGGKHCWFPSILSSVEEDGKHIESNIRIDMPGYGEVTQAVEVTKESLYKSINGEGYLKSFGGRNWSISSEYELTKIIQNKIKPTPYITSILRTMKFITDGMLSKEPLIILSNMVTSYEMLLSENSDFKLLKKRAGRFLGIDPSDKDAEINKIFKLRHKRIHEGEQSLKQDIEYETKVSCYIACSMICACAQVINEVKSKSSLLLKIDQSEAYAKAYPYSSLEDYYKYTDSIGIGKIRSIYLLALINEDAGEQST